MFKVTVNQKHPFDIVQGVAASQDAKQLQEAQWQVNDQPFEWDLLEVRDNTFHIVHNSRSYNAEVVKADYEAKTFTIRINTHLYQVDVKDRFDLLLEKMGMSQTNLAKLNHIKAPMPGLILDIKVQVGDEVKKGDTIMILEAMKMENSIKSTGDGKVKLIKVKKGDNVEKNQLLVEF